MKAQTRSDRILSLMGRALMRAALFLLVLAIAGTVYQTAATEADRRNYPPPGNLVDVGGFKMHIHCEGEGSPTVILEAESGGTSAHWGWIQPEIAKVTKVCAYDRAGFGWSEPDPQPPTLSRTVQNLHTLLANANINGPYVMAGHSLGGVYVRRFAQDYPDEVAGMVLLDEANPQQLAKYPEMFDQGDQYLSMLKAFQWMARLGLWHLYFALGGDMDFAELAELQKSQLKAFWASPRYFEAQGAEIKAGHGIWAEALSLEGLGDRPLMVISRGVDLDYDWDAYQSDLAKLSTNSRHITVEGAGHGALVFDQVYARQVSRAILQVVQAVRSGARNGE